MKKKLFVIFILFVLVRCLIAVEYLELNFFIEPQFEHEQMNMTNFLVKNIRNDSIRQVNVFAGRLLSTPQSDSLTAFFINTIKPDIVSPVDYYFFDRSLQVDLLISNIESDSIAIIKNQIIHCDSFKVGIFSLYSPDFSVRNVVSKHAKLKTDIFKIAKDQVQYLAGETDYIIMLSSLSKYIDNDIVNNLDVDAVVSFDYQQKSNEILSNLLTKFFSVITKNGNYGKLRLEFKNGRVREKWEEVEFRGSEF
ncbi:MAG: hypothetical protein K9N07_04975 [Candidatus Cloacimonetes bacterium]|nr:hypothetical protein [Candidatus Cloacimonadota bacterium]